MENNLILLNIFLISIFFFFLNPIAKIFNLYDFPENRKIHEKPTPLVGGLIIYSIILINFLYIRRT